MGISPIRLDPDPITSTASEFSVVPRRFTIGFGPIQLGPGETQIAYIAPQMTFRADRLIIVSPTPTRLAKIVISDIRFGNRSQILSAEGIPATIFEATAISMLTFDTVQPDVSIAVTLKDIRDPEPPDTVEIRLQREASRLIQYDVTLNLIDCSARLRD